MYILRQLTGSKSVFHNQPRAVHVYSFSARNSLCSCFFTIPAYAHPLENRLWLYFETAFKCQSFIWMTRDVSLMWESALDVFVINKILILLSINVLILLPCVIPKPYSLLQFKFHRFSCLKTIVAKTLRVVWRGIKHYWDWGCIFVYRLLRFGRPFTTAFQK